MSLTVIIIISLLFSAFFSGMEIAYVSANKLKVEVDRKSGRFSARILSRFARSEPSFISTMLVGNNISLVVYGIAFAALLEPFLFRILPSGIRAEFSVFLLQTIISTFIILLFAEFLPKTLFRLNPNHFLSLFALPVYAIYILLYPLITLVSSLSDLLMKKLFNTDTSGGRTAFDIVDMDNFIREFGPEAEDMQSERSRQLQILRNAIEFPDVRIRECMIPRTEIIAVPENETMANIRSLLSRTGLSKILIYRDSIDNITGYVHAFDFFRRPKSIQSIIRPISLVPETMHANKLLKTFIQQRQSIAVVVDEFGGTSGIITIEDIIEEIFGEIDDEYDTDEMVEKRIREGEYVFSARLEIDYLNEKHHLDLPEGDDYETLGGLILNHLESIPGKDEVIQIGKHAFRILQVSEKRIELVQMKGGGN